MFVTRGISIWKKLGFLFVLSAIVASVVFYQYLSAVPSFRDILANPIDYLEHIRALTLSLYAGFLCLTLLSVLGFVRICFYLSEERNAPPPSRKYLRPLSIFSLILMAPALLIVLVVLIASSVFVKLASVDNMDKIVRTIPQVIKASSQALQLQVHQAHDDLILMALSLNRDGSLINLSEELNTHLSHLASQQDFQNAMLCNKNRGVLASSSLAFGLSFMSISQKTLEDARYSPVMRLDLENGRVLGVVMLYDHETYLIVSRKVNIQRVVKHELEPLFREIGGFQGPYERLGSLASEFIVQKRTHSP